MPSKKISKQYSTTTIYFKKHESFFIETCKKYSLERFPGMSFSEFVTMCIKDYVNSLSLEERKFFEECAWELVEKEKLFFYWEDPKALFF